jgi:hypothetical protein
MTATLAPTAQFEPLWEALQELGWMDIPTDLTEIDANWCHCALADLDRPCIDELLEVASWEAMNGFARDLRDTWHHARCEDREFLCYGQSEY